MNASPTAGTPVTTTPSNLFRSANVVGGIDGQDAAICEVQNDGPSDVFVNVPNLGHETGRGTRVRANETRPFVGKGNKTGGISQVDVFTLSGTATVFFSVLAK